ncbi:spermidine/putrescine ABC transporter ATP-binding protein [Finegoldia magna]|uniref:Spermidine/putrescine ABC transporter ATP-binding protein n=1 Tax=Finegoldia magna TaxID=1260 RepID=A0A2N6STM1_FINMA|nr:sn-glycerol-3-phosphate ABC transporter ATP-binding protein UgpC [Finegoldia magna]PMC60411.1 spermidine/putrescine ABC transporter ATP-binding protein [Finegoldia magna]
MSKISLRNIYKRYENSKKSAVTDFNLEIEDKEFIVFVGPSGCGKSTTLRMIAGLEDISEGDLFINGKKMNDVAPKDRGTAMVFQNYALYPHLNVYDNIGFGLKIRGVDKNTRDKSIRKTAEMLSLTPFLKRKPIELSGGQRQRVALGRAIVKESEIFLMDEPLSNLDAKLRIHMRKELVELQQNLGSTVIYVTHDQTEAMTMASRIVCLKDGIIQQVGTPEELYSNPNNMFVGGFLGSPPMNFIKGKIEDAKFYDESSNYICDVNQDSVKDVVLGIRPENIKISNNDSGIKVPVKLIELLGANYNIHAELYGNKITINTDANRYIKDKDELNIVFDANKLLFFDPKTEMRLFLED